MRNRGVLLLALLIAALLAVGATVALIGSGDGSGPKLDTLPTPSPTASPTASDTPSATASATSSPSATSSASETATATATHSPTARATSGTTTYAYPRPGSQYNRLELSLTSNPIHGTVGQDYHVTAQATDGDGTIYFQGLTWGDGRSEPAQANPQHCKSWPALTSRPGPYQPEPDSKSYSFHHAYLAPGDYRITFRVASVNADCKPHGPSTESQVLSLLVHVAAAPTPTATP